MDFWIIPFAIIQILKKSKDFLIAFHFRRNNNIDVKNGPTELEYEPRNPLRVTVAETWLGLLMALVLLFGSALYVWWQVTRGHVYF